MAAARFVRAIFGESMALRFIRTAIFALSERPTVRHREALRAELKREIEESDSVRAQGASRTLSRGSVLLQRGRARLRAPRFE